MSEGAGAEVARQLTIEWVKDAGIPPHFGEGCADGVARLIRWSVGTDRARTRARAAEFGISEAMLNTWPPHADVGWSGQQPFEAFLREGAPELVACPEALQAQLRVFVTAQLGADEAP